MTTDRPIRVCHLGKYYPPAPGGIETHVQTLARAQARQGASVRVVCVNHSDWRGRDVTWARYGATDTLHEMDGDVRVTRLGRSATVARLDFCPSLPWVIKDLNHHPVDILHLHTPNPTMVLVVSSLLRQETPLVITHHSDIVRQRMLKWVHGPFEKMVYERAATILVSSPKYIEGSSTLQLYGNKVQTLPMGIDLDPMLNPSPAALAHATRLRKEHGPVLWLAVGRCVYYKGLHIAIEALRDVPGKLVIVGHGPLLAQLRGMARQRGVAHRIIWWNYAEPDQLIGAYLAATALWFPSVARSEAFGLVQVEAMASGCPVINARIDESGVNWVCPHDDTALTVPAHDPQALAAAARRLLAEPDLRRRLAESAVRRARHRFDHEMMSQRSLDIYREALSRRLDRTEPAGSRLRHWVHRTTSAPDQSELSHARFALVRGEPVRRH